MKTKFISIIVPVYNKEQYVSTCIESVLAQSFKNYELIIVNDGSTDNSELVISQYIHNENVRYIKQKNAGVSAARNKGIEVSYGEWVCFIDPDDYIDSNFLEVLVGKIPEEEGIDIVIAPCKVINKNKIYKEYFFKDNFIAINEEKKRLYFQLCNPKYGQTKPVYTAVGVPWGKLYRKSVLEKNNIRFNEELVALEDNLFNMEFFYYSKKISYINYFGYNYRLIDSELKGIKRFIDGSFRHAVLCREKLLVQLGLINDYEIRCAFAEEYVATLTHEVLLYGSSGISLLRIYHNVRNRYKLIVKYFDRIDNEIIRFVPVKNKILFYLLKNNLFFIFTIICIIKNIKR